MFLGRIQEGPLGYDLRTFECHRVQTDNGLAPRPIDRAKVSLPPGNILLATIKLISDEYGAKLTQSILSLLTASMGGLFAE
jgi:hypothetical protein